MTKKKKEKTHMNGCKAGHCGYVWVRHKTPMDGSRLHPISKPSLTSKNGLLFNPLAFSSNPE